MMLKVEKINVAFDERIVLDDISLSVAQHEVVALLGPSGVGKTTLLKVIAGLLIPNSGSISIDGLDVTHKAAHLRNIGMVFQDNQLFPHMNVARNIEFGLRMQGLEKKIRKDKIHEMLDLVGLSGFEDRSIADLSGGEAKRVALARSLAPSPSVLLLDEPLTGLDRELHDQLAGELTTLLKKTNTTAILVTHDAQEAETIADRILELSSSSGSRHSE